MPKSDIPVTLSLIEKLEEKWKPPAIQVGSPLIRLDEVLAEIRQYLSDPKVVEMVARAIYPLAFEIPYVIPENEYQRLKNQTLEIMKKQALRSATDALAAIGGEIGIKTGIKQVSDIPINQQTCSEIPVIERGTIQHLVKRELPHLLLGLSQREPEDGEVIATEDFMQEIENALESCRDQLEAVMLTKPVSDNLMLVDKDEYIRLNKAEWATKLSDPATVEMVSVSLEKCVEACCSAWRTADKCNMSERDTEDAITKAVLDAAGVKYHED